MILYTVFKGILLFSLLTNCEFLVQCAPKKYPAPKPPNQEITKSDINAKIIPNDDESENSSDLNQVIFVSPDNVPERPPNPNPIASTYFEGPSISSLVEDIKPVKTNDIQTTHRKGIELDLENMKGNYYFYNKDRYIITYTAKNEYLFASVKSYSTMIWKATKPEEHSNKVVLNSIIKRVIIYQFNGEKKIFQRIKSGCCRRAKWEETAEISNQSTIK